MNSKDQEIKVCICCSIKATILWATCWVHLTRLTNGTYICFLFFINELTTRCVWQHMEEIENLKAQFRELEIELKICKTEIKKLTRQQQELADWNKELQELTYQVQPSEKGSDDCRERPCETKKERKPIRCWCCGEEHIKQDSPHSLKRREDWFCYIYIWSMVDSATSVSLRAWSTFLDYLLLLICYAFKLWTCNQLFNDCWICMAMLFDCSFLFCDYKFHFIFRCCFYYYLLHCLLIFTTDRYLHAWGSGSK